MAARKQGDLSLAFREYTHGFEMQWPPKLSGLKSDYILRYILRFFKFNPHPPLKYSFIRHCYSKDLILNDFPTTKSAWNYHELKKLTSEHCHSIPVYVTCFGPYCEVNETTMFWRSFRANLQVAGYILPFCFLGLPDLAVFFFTWLEVLEFLMPGVAACGPSMLLLWKEMIEKGNYNKQSKPGKIWCGASCGCIHTS